MNGAAIEALEVNASCPNLEGRTGMFAHSASLTAELVSACKVAGVPLWVKLSPNTPDIVAIAGAALEAGADGLVLVNTVLGLSIDIESRRAALGNGGGGLSGPGILPVALRSVYEVHQAFPSAPLIGVGGVSSSNDVVAMLMAGASAVEIGTATFANPRAPWKIQRGLVKWMQRNKVSTISELIGAAHA
jgi:dihydroorotate dehydrogenase (NAD+) catalytic subunit